MLVLPLIIGAAVAVGASRFLPDQFRSETLIMLFPQRIPDSYVKPTVHGEIEDRLATLAGSDPEPVAARADYSSISVCIRACVVQLPMEDVV